MGAATVSAATALDHMARASSAEGGLARSRLRGGQDARDLRTRGYRVVGLDRTAALRSFARQRSPTLPLIRADIGQLPLRPEGMDGMWAAASLIHLSKAQARAVLADLFRLMRPGGFLGATFPHGMKSRVRTGGWIPGRYFARWNKDELRRAFLNTGWQVITLEVVTGRERQGRWLNVIAATCSSLR